MPKVKLNKESSKNLVYHPNSRKTAQLAKKNVKAKAREKTKLLHQVKVSLLGEKILWFRDQLLPEVEKYTAQQTFDIIVLYLRRFDEELEQIALKQSIGPKRGRQHASREDAIRLTLDNELNEFLTCGLECPDFMNAAQLTMLRKWDGELRFLQNFKLKRFSKNALMKPPKSLSNKSNETSTHKTDILEKSNDIDEKTEKSSAEMDTT